MLALLHLQCKNSTHTRARKKRKEVEEKWKVKPMNFSWYLNVILRREYGYEEYRCLCLIKVLIFDFTAKRNANRNHWWVCWWHDVSWIQEIYPWRQQKKKTNHLTRKRNKTAKIFIKRMRSVLLLLLVVVVVKRISNEIMTIIANQLNRIKQDSLYSLCNIWVLGSRLLISYFTQSPAHKTHKQTEITTKKGSKNCKNNHDDDRKCTWKRLYSTWSTQIDTINCMLICNVYEHFNQVKNPWQTSQFYVSFHFGYGKLPLNILCMMQF